MTDLRGKHWRQPHDIQLAPIDHMHVLLTSSQFDGLVEYSRTYPSGVYAGKCWVLRVPYGDYLAWYSEHPDDADRIMVNTRRILIGYLKSRFTRARVRIGYD